MAQGESKCIIADSIVKPSLRLLVAMQGKLQQEQQFMLSDLKTVWRIPACEQQKCGESTYAVINVWSYTLKKLVFEGNEAAEDLFDQKPMSQLLANDSLHVAKGLAYMMEARNVAQAKELSEQSGGSSLFADEQPQAKKQKVLPSSSALEMKMRREDPAALDVQLEVNGETYMVSMLRPVHPTDKVWVSCDADMLKAVVLCLRCGGWNEVSSYKKTKKEKKHPYAHPEGLGVATADID